MGQNAAEMFHQIANVITTGRSKDPVSVDVVVDGVETFLVIKWNDYRLVVSEREVDGPSRSEIATGGRHAKDRECSVF